MAKVSRKGVNLGMAEKNGEYHLMLGNQILSRHATEAEAAAAFRAELMTKTYEVTIPVAGHAFMSVEANSEAEAIEIAMGEVNLDNIEDWEPLEQFNAGNVCYCPQPWEAEARCTHDDSEPA